MTPTANDSLMDPYAPLVKRNPPFHNKRNSFTRVTDVWNQEHGLCLHRETVTSRDFLKVCSLQQKLTSRKVTFTVMRMPTRSFSLAHGEMEWMLKERMFLCFMEHHADTNGGTQITAQDKKYQVCAGSHLHVIQSTSSHCAPQRSGQDSQQPPRSGSADEPLQQQSVPKPMYLVPSGMLRVSQDTCVGVADITHHVCCCIRGCGPAIFALEDLLQN